MKLRGPQPGKPPTASDAVWQGKPIIIARDELGFLTPAQPQPPADKRGRIAYPGKFFSHGDTAGPAFAMIFRVNPFGNVNSVSGLADGVGRIGFRKWYERQLMASHAHMLLAFLSVIALLSSLEAMRGGSVNERLVNVLFIIVCAAVGLWALRRYLFLLMRAEEIANQANCPECGEYGRFTVFATNHGDSETQVCCRKCTHKWVITQAE